MARKPRIEYPGALYHVIARGNQQQDIFFDEADYRRYLDLLGSYRKRYALTLYAYVLMTNHVHLLIVQGEAPLSKAMQGLGQSYTGYYNRKYKKSGHLFQGRYKAVLCDRDAYLLELVRYIHLNPVRGGIVKLPDEYPWSSHHAYFRGASGGLVEVGVPLSLMASDRKRAVARYRTFIADGVGEGYREDLHAVREQRFLGPDDFIEEVGAKRPLTADRSLPVILTLAEVAKEVGRTFRVPAERMLGASRSREMARLRAMTACLALDAGGIPLTEAAGHFGRDLSTVSIAVKKLRTEAAKDATLKAQLAVLEERLRTGKLLKYQKSKA